MAKMIKSLLTCMLLYSTVTASRQFESDVIIPEYHQTVQMHIDCTVYSYSMMANNMTDKSE